MPLLYEDQKPDEQDFRRDWFAARRIVHERFGKRPDINAFLFLIGMNELGQLREEWTKEEKQDLMHIALCKLFEGDGFFRFVGFDEEGWPHYEAVKEAPKGKLIEQEQLLKRRIVSYFKEHKMLD